MPLPPAEFVPPNKCRYDSEEDSHDHEHGGEGRKAQFEEDVAVGGSGADRSWENLQEEAELDEVFSEVRTEN